MPTMTKYLTEEFPKPITINLSGTRCSFANFAKMQDWCAKQREFYLLIGNPGGMHNNFQSHLMNPLYTFFNSNRPDEYNFNQLSDEIKVFTETVFNRRAFLDYRSKQGKWLSKLVENDSQLVLGAAQYFISKKNNQKNVESKEGEFAAYLFDQGYSPDFDSEKAKYEEFYNEISESKDALIEELVALKKELTILLKANEEQKSEWSNKIETQLEKVDKDFVEQFNSHDLKMKESEEFYEKKLAVKNAVVYWTDKAIEHKRNSWIFGSISGILMIGMLTTIICFGNYFVGLDFSKGTGAKLLTKSGALQLWVYGFFIISVTMIIWIIRLLVKVFLSNLHQLSDANERATMIQTYLAFEREEKTLTEKDKELVLPSIFRTSAHGIIKEDSAPNSPMNIFMGKG